MDMLRNGIYKIGLGLWNYPSASYVAEALLMVIGMWIYLRPTESENCRAKYGLPVLSAVPLLLNAVSVFGFSPAKMEYLIVTMLTIYLRTIVTAFWIDQGLR